MSLADYVKENAVGFGEEARAFFDELAEVIKVRRVETEFAKSGLQWTAGPAGSSGTVYLQPFWVHVVGHVVQSGTKIDGYVYIDLFARIHLCAK